MASSPGQPETGSFDTPFFRAIVEHSFDAIGLVAADGTVRYTSPAITRILGYGPRELVGRSCFELLHPDYLPHAAQQFAAFAATPAACIVAEARYQHKDGSWRWIEVACTNRLADPAVALIIANYRDVTERKRTDATLREQAAFNRAVLEHAHDAIVICADEKIVYANAAFLRIVGASEPAQVLGKTKMAFVAPEDWELVTARRAARQRGEVPPAVYELRLRRLDEEVVPVEIASVGLSLDGRRVIVGVGRDVSERRRLEAERAERARLDGALLMARTVAHELNNALTPIAGFAELLALRPEITRDPTLESFVQLIGEAAADAAEMVRRLQHIVRLEEQEDAIGPGLSVLDVDRCIEP